MKGPGYFFSGSVHFLYKTPTKMAVRTYTLEKGLSYTKGREYALESRPQPIPSE